jgi:hypothetical protein
LRTLKPIRASTMNLNGRQASPALSATLGPGHMFNASEIGTMPRPGGNLARGMSPGKFNCLQVNVVSCFSGFEQL